MKNLKKLSYTELVKIVTDFGEKQKDPKNKELVLNALQYVIYLHADQKVRPDGPYINHVLRVAVLLILIGVTNPRIVIAALLHDSVEDQTETILKMDPPILLGQDRQAEALCIIYYKFGAVPCRIVRKVTNPDWSGIPEKSERNKLYLDHVKELVSKDPPASMVKLSDFYDNGIGLSSIEDIQRRKVLAQKYLPIFDVFIEGVPKFTDGLISREHVAEIMNDLEVGRAYAEELLAA